MSVRSTAQTAYSTFCKEWSGKTKEEKAALGGWNEYRSTNWVKTESSKESGAVGRPKGSHSVYGTYQKLVKAKEIPNDPSTEKPYLWSKIKEGSDKDPAMKKLHKKIVKKFNEEHPELCKDC